MCQEQTDPFSVACNSIALQPALQVRQPQNQGPAAPETPALRAFAPDSMWWASPSRSTPPCLTLTTRTSPHAPTICSTPAGSNWTSSPRAPRQSASQRSARVNTTRPPSATRAGRLSWTTRRSKRRARAERGARVGAAPVHGGAARPVRPPPQHGQQDRVAVSCLAGARGGRARARVRRPCHELCFE